jgi:hypothetical protein
VSSNTSNGALVPSSNAIKDTASGKAKYITRQNQGIVDLVQKYLNDMTGNLVVDTLDLGSSNH